VVQAADKSASLLTQRAGLACGTLVNWDLAEMAVEDAAFVAELFEHAMRLARVPNPFVTAPPPEFNVGQVASALRYIEQAPYLHHAWIVAGKDTCSEVPVLRRNTTASLRNALDPAGTYLLAGGLGGLGRSICELIVSNGARNLAFLSRSGASSPQSRAFLQDLANRGVNTQAYSVDICDRPALQAIIEGPMARDLPPIRGVFQCAAVIQDSIFDNMTFEAWTTAARPKMSGSWNLAETIKSTNQDPFLIFLASSSGVIGSRSQANYAAGNCFEDALAHSLRAQGRHAVSIDLGPVLGAGMLAEDEGILSILRGSGFYGIRHEDFLKVVEHAITMETVPGVPMPAQVILGVGTGGLMLQNQPADPYWSRTALYSHLNLVDMPPSDLQSGSSSTSKQADLKAMLACCTDAQSAAAMLSEGLMRMLAKATNMLFEEMDPSRTPSSYGVDSLVAVGVRNWVLGSSGVEVSVFEVLSDQTIGDLAAVIADRGGFGVNK
jgi:NAD(P)-dependent dehydrogenase (short-subunit alcohol dehydrogenase family)